MRSPSSHLSYQAETCPCPFPILNLNLATTVLVINYHTYEVPLEILLFLAEHMPRPPWFLGSVMIVFQFTNNQYCLLK
jgi:hypothetical protein